MRKQMSRSIGHRKFREFIQKRCQCFCVYCLAQLLIGTFVFGKARTLFIHPKFILELGATEVFLFFFAFRIIITSFFLLQ